MQTNPLILTNIPLDTPPTVAASIYVATVTGSNLTAQTWTITGVRAHQDPNNHTGTFATVSTTLTVL